MAPASLLRPRLLRRLLAALEVGHVLMVAPAGYGKTTLLRSLVAHRPHTYYLALTPGDVDLAHLRVRFQQAVPPHQDSLLLLDDVHYLEAGPQARGWLVQQMARPAPRLVLSGRSFPLPVEPAPEAVGPLFRLTAADLAFTWDECRTFLAERHRDLTREELMAWHERTGGWPMALALLFHRTPSVSPRAIQTELFPYLAEHLLDGLPPELRRYLYVTAVPLRFNDALARALLGEGERVLELRQEVQRRNLFLDSAELPGWFRYHELVREFLLRTAPFDLVSVFQRAVAWFDAQGDPEMAIEHALAGGLHESAARQLLQIPEHVVIDRGRFLTYRRWVYGLDGSLRHRYPELMVRLGTYLQEVPGMRAEARALLEEALGLASTFEDTLLQQRIWNRMARLAYVEGEREKALDCLRPLLQDPTCRGEQRLYALFLAGPTLSLLGRFAEARETFRAAIALTQEAGHRTMEMFNRVNWALHILIPMGMYEEAQYHLEQAQIHFRGSPIHAQYVLGVCCGLYAAQGDWERLAQAHRAHQELMAQIEAPNRYQLLWQTFNRALLDASLGQFDRAQAALSAAADRFRDDPVVAVGLAGIQTWLLRNRGASAEAVCHAEAVLARPFHAPLSRGVLALERDIAQAILAWDGALESFSLHPETRNLVHWRARSELVRLRALLALGCWREGDPRWRRHLRAALRALKQPGYAHLLTRRDPALGARFWTVALAEDVAVDQALAALQEIGCTDVVARLLHHPDPGARSRAAQALAAIGHETSMPSLAEALAAEQDPETAAALEAALADLESRPPPRLRVRLMGPFALWRGGERIPERAWPRPAARRLFQYFALHQGIPLSRDRILDDLWPGVEPRRAWATFRTIYSQLRRVLDPYMRPRAPARYFMMEDDTYCFDPERHSQVDAITFRSTVRRVLDTAHRFDVPPLPPPFVGLLEGWEPLLPDLPYAEWLLEAREQLRGLYAEGCLYVAQALLVRDRPAEAETWARRTVDTAPWSEEGYQALMRVYARQGKRSLALRTYAQAVDRLQRELDAAPSPLTQWLAERVRQGEEI